MRTDLQLLTAEPLEELQSCMAEIELAFTLEAVHDRADTVTPLLEEMLSTRLPIQWGVSE